MESLVFTSSQPVAGIYRKTRFSRCQPVLLFLWHRSSNIGGHSCNVPIQGCVRSHAAQLFADDPEKQPQ